MELTMKQAADQPGVSPSHLLARLEVGNSSYRDVVVTAISVSKHWTGGGLRARFGSLDRYA